MLPDFDSVIITKKYYLFLLNIIYVVDFKIVALFWLWRSLIIEMNINN